MTTSFQATSSSSAKIMGKAVLVPWPTSGLGARMVTTPDGLMRGKIVTGNSESLAARAPPALIGRVAVNNKPPPTAPLAIRKLRRVIAVLDGAIDDSFMTAAICQGA